MEKIFNPKTNQFVSIFGTHGRTILQKYIEYQNQLTGGGNNKPVIEKTKKPKKITIKKTKKKTGKTSGLFRPIPPNYQLKPIPGLTRFVISMDNEIGKKRRERLNYTNYTHFKGIVPENAPPYIAKKMKNRSNISDMTRRGKVGAWAAHVTMLEKIAREKLNNVLILEDDCFQVRNFKLSDLGDKPIYLNGKFHHPTNYAQRTSDWVAKTYQSYKPKKGINEMDWTKIRIVGMWGIFIPKWEQALEIATKLKEPKKFTTVDSQISNQRLITRFYYPALYRHADFKTSNISKGGWGEAEYWDEKDMRALKKRKLL